MLVNLFLDLCGAKLGRYSVTCSFFCVFLLSLFGHLYEFWPKLGKDSKFWPKQNTFWEKLLGKHLLGGRMRFYEPAELIGRHTDGILEFAVERPDG